MSEVLYVRPVGERVYTVPMAMARLGVTQVLLLPSSQTHRVADQLRDEISAHERIPVRVTEMDHASLPASFATITKAVLNAQHRKIRCIVDVGGGMRTASIAGYMAAHYANCRVVYSFAEAGVERLFEFKPGIVRRIPLTKGLILKALHDAATEPRKTLTYDDISRCLVNFKQAKDLFHDRITTAKPNLTHHLRELEELGYVTAQRDKKQREFALTELGTVVLELKALEQPPPKWVKVHYSPNPSRQTQPR